MVTFRVVSEYSSNPPTEIGRFKISGGPLYDLARVQAIIEDENKLKSWTEKCRKDVFKLFAGDHGEVAKLIDCLRTSDYIDSEWCENGKGSVAACDAYKIRRPEEMPATGKVMTVEYFLKFAIGTTGNLVLVVSCHT